MTTGSTASSTTWLSTATTSNALYTRPGPQEINLVSQLRTLRSADSVSLVACRLLVGGYEESDSRGRPHYIRRP
jgi:hypothetical protein